MYIYIYNGLLYDIYIYIYICIYIYIVYIILIIMIIATIQNNDDK